MSKHPLKIALVKPPIIGHLHRGTGIYAEQLFNALKKRNDVDIELINYNNSTHPFDLIHYPYFDPFFLTLPIIHSKPIVVTVHDLIPLRYPTSYPKGLKGIIKWFIQKISLKQSQAVITDSYASAKDIERYVSIPKEKISVIYLGVGDKFRIITSTKLLENTRFRLRLPEEYLLHVGDVNFNKNIDGILRAFTFMRKTNPSLYLVFIGVGFVNPSPELNKIIKLIAQLSLSKYILRIGHVSEEELVCVYNLAAIYLQPSFAEGFGLPVLEAMACGVPVVSSARDSLSEILGDSGLVIDPTNYEGIAGKVSELIKDKSKREKLIQKGFQKAKQFSWDKTALQTVEVYKKVI